MDKEYFRGDQMTQAILIERVYRKPVAYVNSYGKTIFVKEESEEESCTN